MSEWNVFLKKLVSWGKWESYRKNEAFSWGRNKTIMSELIVYFLNYLDDVANYTWWCHLLLLVINICPFKIARERYKQNTSWSSSDSTDLCYQCLSLPDSKTVRYAPRPPRVVGVRDFSPVPSSIFYFWPKDYNIACLFLFFVHLLTVLISKMFVLKSKTPIA